MFMNRSCLLPSLFQESFSNELKLLHKQKQELKTKTSLSKKGRKEFKAATEPKFLSWKCFALF